MRLGDPRRQPLDLHVELLDLELDQRLRDRTPQEYAKLWDLFRPSGVVGAEIDMTRTVPDGPVDARRQRHLPRRRGHVPPFPLPARPPQGFSHAREEHADAWTCRPSASAVVRCT